MRRAIIVVVLTFVASGGVAQTRARPEPRCRSETLAGAFSAHTHVFSGKAVSILDKKLFPFSPKDPALYGKDVDCLVTVKVDHSFRGDVPKKAVLRGNAKDGQCVPLTTGDRFIFFVDRRADGALWRSRCDPAAPWSWEEASALARLAGQSKDGEYPMADDPGTNYGYCGRERVRLDAIIEHEHRRQCIIDGDLHSPGDRIGHGRIVRVDKLRVTLDCVDKRLELSIESD